MECITSANKATKPEGFIFDIGSLYSSLSRVSNTSKPKGVRYPLALILDLAGLWRNCVGKIDQAGLRNGRNRELKY